MSSGSEEHITCIHRCPVVSVSVTEEQAQAFTGKKASFGG